MDITIDKTKESKNINQMYLLLTLGMVSFWLPYTIAMIISASFFIGATLVCYSRYKYTVNTHYQSHYRWMIRTFWIGTGVFLPLAISLMTFIVVQFGEMSAFKHIIYMTSDINALADSIESSVYVFISDNSILLFLTLLVTCLPAMLWWYARLWRGHHLLIQGRSIDNVKTWLI